MSEEEIIEELTVFGKEESKYKYGQAIQGLLDLYNKEKLNTLNLSEQLNKEKEKNKKIEEYIKQCDWHNDDVYIGEDILDILEE